MEERGWNHHEVNCGYAAIEASLGDLGYEGESEGSIYFYIQ